MRARSAKAAIIAGSRNGQRIAGYRAVHVLANSAINRSLALLLLLIAPAWLVVAVSIKLADGGPVLYRGTRLGYGKRAFIMYKFRTLRPDADQVIGASLLHERLKLEIPIGGLLRETRLDELPQLWNVMIGDMDLIGPRPERPEIYERLCRHIPGYDLRFDAKPGLIGYAQIFTPHGSPKRLRSLVDNFYLRRNQELGHDLRFLGYALLLVRALLDAVTDEVGSLVRRLLHGPGIAEQRQLRRVMGKGAKVCIIAAPSTAGDTPPPCYEVIDVNQDALMFFAPQELHFERARIVLAVWLPSRTHAQGKRKRVDCAALMMIKRPCAKRCPRLGATPWEHVVQIEPISPLNAFKLQKYFLMSSIS